jgi:hypothetical protein
MQGSTTVGRLGGLVVKSDSFQFLDFAYVAVGKGSIEQAQNIHRFVFDRALLRQDFETLHFAADYL